MALIPGTRRGIYEVLSSIGADGEERSIAPFFRGLVGGEVNGLLVFALGIDTDGFALWVSPGRTLSRTCREST